MNLKLPFAKAPKTPLTAQISARTTPKERGQMGEELAANYLLAHGYNILARNWRPGKVSGDNAGGMRGEIDCIAWHGKTLCFIEVKTRASDEFGAPQQAVTPAKQRQISRLANAYVSFAGLDETPCRFDVVEVWLPQNSAPRLVLHRNAFDYCDSARPHRFS